MTLWLLFLLVAAALCAICEAQCLVKPAGKKGCVHDGKWHRVAAVWKAGNCLRCECKATELICCSLVSRPINYDKRVCVAMFHRQSCSIRVVKKTNPAESCQVFTGVG